MYSNYDYIYYQALTNLQYEMVSNFHNESFIEQMTTIS